MPLKSFLVPATATFALLGISACGTVVPQVEEFWESGSIKTLERKVKEKIYCELNDAVNRLNTDTSRFVFVGGKPRFPVPVSWGATMTLTFTIAENTAISPGLSYETPLSGLETFTFGIGGSLSAEATRTDKYTFFYLVEDLQHDTGECKFASEANPNGRLPSDVEGSSPLLQSELGIYKWLDEAVDIRSGVGVSANNHQQVLSYDIKFNVVSSGSLNPSWKLVRVSTTSNPLFSTKRDRTHNLTINFGPVEGKGKEPVRPSALLLNDNLSLQFRNAVSDGLRSAFPR